MRSRAWKTNMRPTSILAGTNLPTTRMPSDRGLEPERLREISPQRRIPARAARPQSVPHLVRYQIVLPRQGEVEPERIVALRVPRLRGQVAAQSQHPSFLHAFIARHRHETRAKRQHLDKVDCSRRD